MKFLYNKPAMIIEDALVVSDLHIGIEYEYYRSGIKIPNQTKKLTKEIKKLLKENKLKKLIILGDLKHKIPWATRREEEEIVEFLNEIYDIAEIDIVLGNHDGGLKSILSKNIKVHPSKGFLLGETYLLHGNSWPSEDFLKAKYVVMGHAHPLFEIKDSLGYRWAERCWLVKAKLDKKQLEKHFKTIKTAPELVVMPAFNEMVGGKPINKVLEPIVSNKKSLTSKTPKRKDKRYIGPLVKCMKKPKVYLLDGVELKS